MNRKIVKGIITGILEEARLVLLMRIWESVREERNPSKSSRELISGGWV